MSPLPSILSTGGGDCVHLQYGDVPSSAVGDLNGGNRRRRRPPKKNPRRLGRILIRTGEWAGGTWGTSPLLPFVLWEILEAWMDGMCEKDVSGLYFGAIKN